VGRLLQEALQEAGMAPEDVAFIMAEIEARSPFIISSGTS
jgi:hypothetical protein